MFSKMYMIIEQNKLKERFEGTVTTAILEVINKETDERNLEYIYQLLFTFNDVVKSVDCMTGIKKNGEQWNEYEEATHEMYINLLLKKMNTLYMKLGKLDFLQQFSKTYWRHNQEFILQLWKEMPKGKSVTTNEASFIKIFEDLFAETLKVFPEFLIKQLHEFHNMYRASRYEVYDNYKYIMPDPLYCHDNRWNDDGVAFLYLSYDNEGKQYQNINWAQKTCFEEIRAEDGEQLSVCKFKVVHRRVKILDLSFDGIDYDAQVGELNGLEKIYKEKMMSEIQKKSKLRNRLMLYAKDKNEEAFRKELNKLQKKLGLDIKMHYDVQLQLSLILMGNICDAIFYAVDREDDPKLEAYIPFRAFSRYLIAKGFGGVAYKSTRMAKIGLQGKCLTLFDKSDAIYVNGEMEVYEYHKEKCDFIKKY